MRTTKALQKITYPTEKLCTGLNCFFIKGVCFGQVGKTITATLTAQLRIYSDIDNSLLFENTMRSKASCTTNQADALEKALNVLFAGGGVQVSTPYHVDRNFTLTPYIGSISLEIVEPYKSYISKLFDTPQKTYSVISMYKGLEQSK